MNVSQALMAIGVGEAPVYRVGLAAGRSRLWLVARPKPDTMTLSE
jgi:hypothetical protein